MIQIAVNRFFKYLDNLSTSDFALLGTLSLSLILRLKGILTKDIWYDEALTILQSQKTIPEIIKDVPTPVHYLITHLFTLLSDQILIFRIPSVLFGILSIYLLYLIGSLIFNRRIGLMAAFLLAISPVHIEFSQQILFFSYFAFFSLLSLYFLLLFTQSMSKKTNWLYLLFFAMAAILNILNIMLGLIVTVVEITYLALTILTHQSKKNKLTTYLFILLIISIGVVIYNIPGYKNFFENLISIDFKKPITLGYSLSHRLNNINLVPSVKFFYLMFSWLGYGYEFNFYLLFIPFLVGLAAYSISYKRKYLPLILLWLVLPFVMLFIIRLDHWFEEKYFIFIAPIYLLICAYGINILSILIKNTVKLHIFNQLALIFLLIAALNSLKTTTSFGYSFPGHVGYDWNIVYRYLNETLKPGDKVLLPKDGTLFLDIYFGQRAKDYILDETIIARMSADEFQKLVDSSTSFYFVSIPDFSYLYLAPAAQSERLVEMGNFGIYKLKFKKQTPFPIEAKSYEWNFHEDFRTSSYLSQAEGWLNFTPSYATPSFDEKLVGVNVLKPSDQNQAELDYRFTLPPNSTSLKLAPVFFLSKERKFQIFAGPSESKINLIFEQKTDKDDLFNPEINLATYNLSHNLYIKFVFTRSNSGQSDLSFLKLINLSGKQPNGEDDSKYTITTTAEGKTSYLYNSEQEVIKNPKWFSDTIKNHGWFQTNEGFLVKYFGEETTPLIYYLSFTETIDMMKLLIKASNHYTNPLDAYYSTDGEKWTHLSMLDKNIPHIYEFALADLNSSKFYLKFHTKLIGPSSQIRNINIEGVTK